MRAMILAAGRGERLRPITDTIPKPLVYFSPEDMLLRILVFKIFNKIETWEYIEQT